MSDLQLADEIRWAQSRKIVEDRRHGRFGFLMAPFVFSLCAVVSAAIELSL